MGKNNKAQALTLPRIRYMSCFELTHAPVATTARAAATGPVSMSTRPTFVTQRSGVPAGNPPPFRSASEHSSPLPNIAYTRTVYASTFVA